MSAALLTWQELHDKPLVLSRVSVQSFLPSATSFARLPDAGWVPLGRIKSFAFTLAAPQGLQGLNAFFTAQGLQGLHAFLTAQGLHGLQAFFTAQGLHGLQAFFVEHGLHGLVAWATAIPRLAAQGLAVLAVTASRDGAVMPTMPPRMAAHSGFRLTGTAFRIVFMFFSRAAWAANTRRHSGATLA
ncbi:MAG TPA: hypothetical protein VIT83_00530 [Gammaproteobacteria bacterium]